jgi:hypothetical protein
MIDSLFLIAAGFSALILLVTAGAAILAFFPALAIYCGMLWMAFFSWSLRMLGIVILFAIFIICMIVAGLL